MFANSWSAVILSALGSSLGPGWTTFVAEEVEKMLEGADGLGEVPGGDLPIRALRL